MPGPTGRPKGKTSARTRAARLKLHSAREKDEGLSYSGTPGQRRGRRIAAEKNFLRERARDKGKRGRKY